MKTHRKELLDRLIPCVTEELIRIPHSSVSCFSLRPAERAYDVVDFDVSFKLPFESDTPSILLARERDILSRLRFPILPDRSLEVLQSNKDVSLKV